MNREYQGYIMNTNLERFVLDENRNSLFFRVFFYFQICNSDCPDICQHSLGYPLHCSKSKMRVKTIWVFPKIMANSEVFI